MNMKRFHSFKTIPERVETSPRINYKRLGWLVFGLGLILVLTWILIVLFRVDRIVKSLNESQVQATEMLEDGLLEVDPGEASALVTEIRDDVMQLDQLTGPFVSVAPAFAWLPVLGPTLENAPALMDMAVSGSEAGFYLLQGLLPALESVQQTDLVTDWSTTTFEELESAQPFIRNASEAAASMAEARSKLTNTNKLPWRIQELLIQVDRFLPEARKAMLASQFIPQIIGTESEKTYLILAQNEDELRPTGGFISGVGLLEVNQGKIQTLSFGNAYLVDDYENKPYDLPPEPLSRFLGMDLFLFRDANFWPDFSASARKAMNLYTYGQGIELDGVIAIDQHFIKMLLETAGPVVVPELESTVKAGNVVEEMRNQWGPDDELQSGNAKWIGQRKEFMQPLARAIQEKILEEADLLSLSRVIIDAFEEKHLQIYIADPEVNRILQELNWNGHMSPEAGGDFVSVIESNIGFNKVNAIVEREYQYEVDFDEEGQGHAKLTISYKNNGPVHQLCEHGTVYSEITRYEDLISDCYWNYLRVYVPLDSRLRTSSQHPIQANSLLVSSEWDGQTLVDVDIDGKKTIFENMLLIPVGEEALASFEYYLPDGVLLEEDGTFGYNLRIRKQAGTTNDSIAVRIKLPPGATVSEYSQNLAKLENGELHYSGVLETDLFLEINFELASSSD